MAITDKARDRSRWDQNFAAEDYYFGTAPNAFLASQAHRLSPGQTALAIADGEGRNGVWLAKQGLAVTSVDLSPVGIAKSQRLAAKEGVTVANIHADLEAWDWGAPRFDVVVGIFFQFAPPHFRDMLFRRMEDVVKPGGLLMIEGYRPEQIGYGTGGPSEVAHLYTEAMLRGAFAGMEILYLAEYDAAITEGSRHRGMSALIDFVARKPS